MRCTKTKMAMTKHTEMRTPELLGGGQPVREDGGGSVDGVEDDTERGTYNAGAAPTICASVLYPQFFSQQRIEPAPSSFWWI